MLLSLRLRLMILQYKLLSFLFLMKLRINGNVHHFTVLLFCSCLCPDLQFVWYSFTNPSIRFKNNGDNFSIPLPLGEPCVSNVSVPEDLVQLHAYLRWERRGKQIYTPEQEKASSPCNFMFLSLNCRVLVQFNIEFTLYVMHKCFVLPNKRDGFLFTYNFSGSAMFFLLALWPATHLKIENNFIALIKLKGLLSDNHI